MRILVWKFHVPRALMLGKEYNEHKMIWRTGGRGREYQVLP